MLQHTVNDEVAFAGIGVHGGQPARVRIVPGGADTGIVFFREDLAPGMPIPASWRFVTDTTNCVTLGRESVSVRTVEHLLAAFAACGIDNAGIHVSGPEIPLLDGGAAEFLDAILRVGLAGQECPRLRLTLNHPLWVEEGDRYLLALPSRDFRISCSIHFRHPQIRYQACHIRIDPRTFREEIAPARTFGFSDEIEAMRERGLAGGGSYDTVLVYGEDGPVATSLRFEDECVRHKVLDITGDLALLGRPFNAHVIGHKTGHALDLKLVRQIDERAELGADDDLSPGELDRQFREFCERVNL